MKPSFFLYPLVIFLLVGLAMAVPQPRPSTAAPAELLPGHYLKAANAQAGDIFGWSVAIDGNTLVVGAYTEDGSATGVNGIPDNGAASSGAAYVFVREGGVWSQQAYLKASNTDMGDGFGSAVAISGNTIVVGATGEGSSASGVNGDQNNNDLESSGALYVFVREGGVWSQQAYIKASNPDESDGFGSAVAIAGDTIVAGAKREDGDATGVNGTPNNNLFQSGAAYVFVRQGQTWSQQAYLKASNPNGFDEFGEAVAISGDTIVVGARGERSGATGVNGDQTDNSVGGAGAAYVFVRQGQTWSQQAYLKSSNPWFGQSFGRAVAISGQTIVVGAPGEASNATGVNGDQSDISAVDAGAAYVFVREGETWSQQAYLKASNTDALDAFGTVVAIHNEAILVSTFLEDSNATGMNGNQADNSASSAGAAYLFLREEGAWSQQAYLKASNTDTFDGFGVAGAIGEGMVVVGAYSEASNATGIDGDQSDNSAQGAGAVYTFEEEEQTGAPLALGVMVVGSGVVTSDPAGIVCGVVCTAEYPPQTIITLTATAETGYTFTGWSGSTTSLNPTLVLPLNTPHTLTATFTVNPSPTSPLFLPMVVRMSSK